LELGGADLGETLFPASRSADARPVFLAVWLHYMILEEDERLLQTRPARSAAEEPALEKIAIQIREADHVATAVSELLPGDVVIVSGVRNGHVIEVKEQIPLGHKIALRPIATDQEIFKYGEPIGIATADIETGCWVHIHNCLGAKARRFSRRSSGET